MWSLRRLGAAAPIMRRVPIGLAACCSSSSSLVLGSPHCRRQMSSTSAPGVSSTTATSPSVADVATYMYSSKRRHQQLHAADDHDAARLLEVQAWQMLQKITDEDVESADARDNAELLVSWNYFARFWENGMDGPSRAVQQAAADGRLGDGTGAHGAPGGHPVGEEAGGDVQEVPMLTREAEDMKRERRAREDLMAPSRRASPLDEILDF